MRKLIISLAAAGTALAVAAPAAAQYYPQQQQPYGYGAPQQYGYGQQQYGYNNYGQARALQARIAAVQFRIDRLGRRGGSNGLRKEARNIERQLQRSARYGLNPYQANDLSNRIARLEQRVNYAMSGRYGRYGNGYNNGYGANGYNSSYGYSDRDGDHRDDRYEDDRGNRRDD
jgi:opacity protein-like surface antigen